MVGVAFICCTFVAKIKCHFVTMVTFLKDVFRKFFAGTYRCYDLGR